jgi:Protein of unknown function (DUF1588)/Protein of unknown function (DUF1592)/Protein of unknown function (DUF1595)
MTSILNSRNVAVAALGAVALMAAASQLGAQTPAAPAAAPAVAAQTDQQFQKTDPELFGIAKQYFPANDSAVPTKRIFRLTREQIDATAAALLPDYAPKSIKAFMPKDPLQTNYEFAEILNFNPANVGGLSGWVNDITARVVKNPNGIVNCAAGAAADCPKAAVRAFVVKAFRGDVSEEKIAAITEFYLKGVRAAGAGQAAADLVEVVLKSPNFLFRSELDVTRTGRLSPAQLLQSVTYTIADAPPDKLNLPSGQASQYLRTGTEAYATINELVRSPAAREKLLRFMTAWLEIKEPGDFTISQAVFPEFDAKMNAAMLEETRQFLTTQLSKPSPSLKDLTQSTPVLASAKPGNPAQRMGVLSMPAVVASHSGPTNTRPIKRGVFWARKVMCMELEPPPPGTSTDVKETPGMTERQRIEEVTKGKACIGCHKIINPFAFFQENYDALGRWRTTDNGSPIDASIMIDFLDEDPVKTTGPVDGIKTLTSSMMFKQCFVRQMFRYYMGRKEDASDDPLLRRMFFEFAYKDKQDILSAVQTLASSDRIVRRQ